MKRIVSVMIALLLLLALCFVIFTFQTPTLGIFKDPLTDTFGIPA